MRPEDDPRQMSFEIDDEARKRREAIVEGAKTASRPTAELQAGVSANDRRRALSRWKSGWLAWHESGMSDDGYEDLLTLLVGSPTLDALIERYHAQHSTERPAPCVDAAHYNAGARIERRNAGLV